MSEFFEYQFSAEDLGCYKCNGANERRVTVEGRMDDGKRSHPGGQHKSVKLVLQKAFYNCVFICGVVANDHRRQIQQIQCGSERIGNIGAEFLQYIDCKCIMPVSCRNNIRPGSRRVFQQKRMRIKIPEFQNARVHIVQIGIEIQASSVSAGALWPVEVNGCVANLPALSGIAVIERVVQNESGSDPVHDMEISKIRNGYPLAEELFGKSTCRCVVDKKDGKPGNFFDLRDNGKVCNSVKIGRI